MIARRLGNKPVYIPVTYIQSTGNQWIDTGIIVTDKTYDFEIVGSFTALNPSATPQGMFGLMGSPSHPEIPRLGLFTYNSIVGAGVNSTVTFTSQQSDTNLHVYKLMRTTNTVWIDSNMISLNDSLTISLSSSLYLFARRRPYGPDNFGRCKMYEFTVYQSGVVIQHLIPVLHFGVPCMFDTVSEQFFYNNSSTNFLYG
jgi:hypothetical protein